MSMVFLWQLKYAFTRIFLMLSEAVAATARDGLCVAIVMGFDKII